MKFWILRVESRKKSFLRGFDHKNTRTKARKINIVLKTPHNSYGQMAPPGYANNQRAPQKSSLELLMENYVANQSKQLQELKNQIGFLNDSLAKLSSKVTPLLLTTKC